MTTMNKRPRWGMLEKLHKRRDDSLRFFYRWKLIFCTFFLLLAHVFFFVVEHYLSSDVRWGIMDVGWGGKRFGWGGFDINSNQKVLRLLWQRQIKFRQPMSLLINSIFSGRMGKLKSKLKREKRFRLVERFSPSAEIKVAIQWLLNRSGKDQQ